MSLHIIWTTDERLVCRPVEAALRNALDSHGRAILLVPDFRAQADASKALSALDGLSLGVTVNTPLAWAKERWDVWGDGTQVIEAVTRTMVAQQVMGEAVRMGRTRLAYNPGTVNVLTRLAAEALPWLPLGSAGESGVPATSPMGLTRAEAETIDMVGSYASVIRSLGLVEESEVMARVVDVLRGQGVATPPLVLAGFGEMRRATRELVVDLAGVTEVTLVGRRLNPEATRQLDRAFALVAETSRQRGVAVSYTDDPDARPSTRNIELQAVTAGLFSGRPGKLEPGTPPAVSRVLAAGPTAEAEAVAREVGQLVADGCRRVVVSSRDVPRAWRELAPKLQARGVSVRAELRMPITRLEAGRAFLEFAEAVAALCELDAVWPQNELTDEGEVVRLGDMLWWPPSGLTDFLQSDLSGIPLSRAERIDVSWRSDRLLTPADVLELLQNERQTSPRVAAATRELLRGHLGSAASKLLMPRLVPGTEVVEDVALADDGATATESIRPTDALADASAAAALEGVLRVAGTLKELGVTADPRSQRFVQLSELVSLAREALSQTQVVLRPEVDGIRRGEEIPAGGGSPLPQVVILGPQQVAQLQPGSADALVLCGQTSAESPVEGGDDVLSSLLATLGVEPERDTMGEERVRFLSQVAAARTHLVVERTARDAASKECYPSVMLTEVLACYAHPEDLPTSGLGERDAAANVHASGEAPTPVSEEVPRSAGRVSETLRPLVVVPQEGRAELLDGRPVLSASQIESYLECPYKWFSLRRLRLQDSDAGFGAVEMGTFAHRVLEVTHRQLLEEALLAMGERGEEAPEPEADPAVRVPGSRVAEDDPATLARARELLDSEFDAHLRHQFLLAGKRSRYQAFVPHTAKDEGRLRALRRDLLSVLDYEAGLFWGFEPRLFEWGFGRHGDLVPYAGAWLTGTIDRVDVDSRGRAVVIDYKHKGAAGFGAEYGVFPEGGHMPGEDLALPRRVQSLIYGQVVRHLRPDLRVVAAVYLATRGQTHVVSGAVDADAAAAVYGSHDPSDKLVPRVAVANSEDFGRADESGMPALLDATEDAIAEQVDELVHGNVEARPRDALSCSFCPVMNCERRLAR